MANINALSQASIPVYNVQVPAEGPLHIPLLLDFTANPTYFIDGKPVIDSGNFSMIQTLWIDAINATANVIVVISGINQTIIAKPGTQGYYPVLVPNPFHVTISCASVSSPGALVTVSLINVPIAFGQWPNGSVGPAGPPGPTGPTGPTGPVSSVGLVSTDLAVSGSPITSSGNITANLATTAVTPGTYGDATHVAQFTVDSKGRLTAAGNVVITAGTVSSVGLTSADLVITGSPVTSSGNINANLPTTAVTPGTYGDATHVGQFTVDSKGRLTAASNVAVSGSVGSLAFLAKLDASGSASLDFATVFSANPSYDEFIIEVMNTVPVTNLDSPIVRFSTDGATFDSGAHYSWAAFRSSLAGNANSGSAATTSFGVDASGGVSSTALNGGASYTIRVRLFNDGTDHPTIDWTGGQNDGSGNPDVVNHGRGTYLVTTAATGFQYKFNSSNTASGSVRVYGLAHA